MIARDWAHDRGCYFCGASENVDHLLFSCSIAKVVWHIMALCFSQNSKSRSYEEFRPWIHMALSVGDNVSMLGLTAVLGDLDSQEQALL
jgi:hypothetical protein